MLKYIGIPDRPSTDPGKITAVGAAQSKPGSMASE